MTTTELPLAVPMPKGTMLTTTRDNGAVGWRYAIRSLQPVVITLALCVTAIICVWIASNRAPATAGPRYQTIDFDDEDGKTLLKFDRESGRAWRLEKMRVPVRARLQVRRLRLRLSLRPKTVPSSTAPADNSCAISQRRDGRGIACPRKPHLVRPPASVLLHSMSAAWL